MIVPRNFSSKETVLAQKGSHSLLSLFSKFLTVGIVNTAIHWITFYVLLKFDFSQSLSNLFAFATAVTFSFYVNGKYTFQSKTSLKRYVTFTAFMGVIAFTFGLVSDYFKLPGLVTLILFSGTSLVIGFLFSKYVVFKEV